MALVRDLSGNAPGIDQSINSKDNQQFRLASGQTITDGGTTTPVRIPGGAYFWELNASAFNSGTVKLQYLGPDGITWLDVASASLTANGAVAVVIGKNTFVRLIANGGAPAAVFSDLV